MKIIIKISFPRQEVNTSEGVKEGSDPIYVSTRVENRIVKQVVVV